tara:strand:+ start:2850 stop:3017 length:168 start_codon:yes stop_codon:yes gene_type:complete
MIPKEEQAILNFYSKFAQYVKEVDIEMWNRAKEYAKDYHDTDGVLFVETKSHETE